MPMMNLLREARRIAVAAVPETTIVYGPWDGSMRSISADRVPKEYLAESDTDAASPVPSSNFLYLPRTGHWKRRLGQVQRFDTFGAAAGMLPAKWSSKCRQLSEFLSDSVSDGIPTVMALLTKETIASGLDDGRFSNVWIRDQVNNLNYTIGSEYSSTTYPVPGTTQSYKFVPLWYDSGDGGLTRGTAEFARRFLFSGSRRFEKIGNWWYFPSLLGTPSRWQGLFTSSTGTTPKRLIPSGPIQPCHAGSLAKGTVVAGGTSTPLAPDAHGAAGIGGWTDQAGGVATIYTTVDETTADDADYIKCTTGAATGEFTIANPGFAPSSSTHTVTIKFRSRSVVALGTAPTLAVELHTASGGGSPQATISLVPTSSFALTSVALSPTQIAAVTAATADWSSLWFRFNVAGGTAGTRDDISQLWLEINPIQSEIGGWKGHDRFYFSVAYRFEDDSIWMACRPRAPNATLTNGFNLFTVDLGNPSTSYDSVVWSNLPIPPYGVKRLILLRSPKIDATSTDNLELNPFDLRVVAEVDAGVTTYTDYGKSVV